MSELITFYDGREIGTLTRTPKGRLTFTYSQDADVPLSPSLPLAEPAHPPKAVETFVEGLLPENEATRTRWARRFKTSARPFDLLAHMGLECAGAVQFAPEERRDEVTSGGHYEPVDEQYIGKRLREVGADGASWTRPDEAWSLAGAQAKFALAYIDGRWFEAHGAAPTTHIFKPGISRLKHQASVEHLTARVFDRLGVRAAPTRIEAFDGVPALVVTRYDRRRVPLTASAASRRPTPPPTGRPAGWHNRIARVHQVDLCQALKYSPLNKYEAERGPGIRQVVDLLRRVGDNGGVEAFAKAAIANVVTGSPDAHAKNYSLLWLEGRWLLAPVYDVATALPYDSSVGEIDTVAMAVGGERRLDRIGRHHWAKFATAVGFPQDTVHSWLFEMLDEVEAAFNAELDMLDVELGQKELRDRLLPTLSHHIARLRRLYAPR